MWVLRFDTVVRGTPVLWYRQLLNILDIHIPVMTAYGACKINTLLERTWSLVFIHN
jgi:hypothetical protein